MVAFGPDRYQRGACGLRGSVMRPATHQLEETDKVDRGRVQHVACPQGSRRIR